MQNSLLEFFKKAADPSKISKPKEQRYEKKRNQAAHHSSNVEKILLENPNDENGRSKSFIRPIELISKQTELDQNHKVNILGTEVYFPKKPYDIQVAYMSKVIESLDKGQNALLQSPTGTGKTLCLLCSSIAWMKKERDRQRASKFA
jgi:primosomal protein N'